MLGKREGDREMLGKREGDREALGRREVDVGKERGIEGEDVVTDDNDR